MEGRISKPKTLKHLATNQHNQWATLNDQQWAYRVHYRPRGQENDDWLAVLAGPCDDYDERPGRIRAALARRLRQLARRHFTAKQYRIFELAMTGDYTQAQIASMIGCCQANVFTTLYGCRFRKGGNLAGGALPKLRRLAAGDWMCRALLVMLRDTTRDAA